MITSIEKHGLRPECGAIFSVKVMCFVYRSGDVIELINTASSDWWKGSMGEKKGYFPASYVQVCTRDTYTQLCVAHVHIEE